MPTVTARRPSAKSTGTAREFSCRFVSITIEISDFRYAVDLIPAGEFGTAAFRLTKRGGDHATYDLVRTHAGLIECDCPSYETTHRDTPEMCKHGRALVELGLLPGPTPALVSEERWTASSQAPRLLASIQTLPTVDLEPIVNNTPWWEQERECGVCHRTGKGRADRADGIIVCGPCNKREDEAAALKAFMATPAPCCSPEAVSCLACETPTPVADVATELLERGLAIAAEVNQPIVLPDHYEDEAPALDFEPTDAERAEVTEAFTAMDCQAFLDRSGELPLEQAIDHIAVTFRGWNSPFGSMLAQVMEELAAKAFAVGATTPAELLTGLESLDREARET